MMSIGTVPIALSPSALPGPRSAFSWEGHVPPLRRFTEDEYQRMIRDGIVKDGSSEELLDGWVVQKNQRGAEKFTPRRWTVAEYHRLIKIGVLLESERVELLEGWIVHHVLRNTPHDTALGKTEEALRNVLPKAWRPRTQMAITTSASEPEPDIAVVNGGLDDYLESHPMAKGIGFVVEVSDSSLGVDRGTKAVVYARAAIEIYWIVNIPVRQIEVYSKPSQLDGVEGLRYSAKQIYREADFVPVVLLGQEVSSIPVANLLPRS